MEFSSPETWRWIWVVMAVTFALGEIAVAGSFFLLPFAIGAAVAALLGFAGASVAIEWLAFVAVSGAASAVLIPLGRHLDRRSHNASVGASRWVGREAIVLRDIPGDPGATGLVRLDREEWRAESLMRTPIRAGSTVLVNRVDGTRLVVVLLEEPALPIDPAKGPGSPE